MVFGKGTRLLAGAVTVACVVMLGPSAPDGLFGGAQPAEAVKDIVPNRVMTWNMCNPCKESNVERAAEIAAYAPQVIGLQEACARDVERIREYLESLHGLVYHVEYGTVLRNWNRCGGVPWSPGGYGQAILSAAPMTDRVNVEYPDGGSEDRGYLAVTTTVGGESVRVFNTHLAQRQQAEVRAEQIRVLAPVVARYDRAVLVGDFNAVPDAPELAPLWKLATDTDPECRPALAGDCEVTTDWQSKFDYVFLRGITALRHEVRLTEVSDHNLLHTDLDLG
ncbi:endonuclease/exonuclease/phosphatase family protein [Streptomyces caniscabiei]|uniref:Endonuclease/exonuclease/phosphatase family protein n=1 Tax=Streptomyces caniscabiei TaxID=2746961 RepID=A0A927L317_9ACTN|nr:endonuclease/exonuclease/phosphatase family protein [Streptomyces caniscabiei]MBD9724083.1 endonuclease/exonuclease/phosphatase family protein [Streptomyces caniscabiei]MDX3515802.1 endonuclease/exonuclease/phosphatase family protein [Streptomyces caniscabiei]MDX3718565.1 endonuclease/exonuclease/phosphatase family protein [Streptomyces caniscabiei]WEO22036.1 endonuclease/exonuclease/phosphatase family protein [Streptomyces caniscabiei]